MSESPPETNGTNRRDEEKSQKETINFNFEKKPLPGISFSYFYFIFYQGGSNSAGVRQASALIFLTVDWYFNITDIMLMISVFD